MAPSVKPLTMTRTTPGGVLIRASLDGDLRWSVNADAPTFLLEEERDLLQDATDEELQTIGPQDGDRRNAILRSMARQFRYDVERATDAGSWNPETDGVH